MMGIFTDGHNDLINDMHDLREQIEQLKPDAERYRKLRDAGDHQTFGEYVVVKCDGLLVGTQTWSGKRLDAICDAMEAADGKPE